MATEQTGEVAAYTDTEGRFPGFTGGLRRGTARGTLINSGFRIGISGLAFLQRLLIAILLTPTELGVWGLILISLLALSFIKEAGISDKFIQQTENDQELAFQKAFSIDLILTAGFVIVAAAALPVFALIYGQEEIIIPGILLLLATVGRTFQAPTWIFYRRMDFVRQRSLEAIDPVVTFILTLTLAAAGAGYWSLVIGAVAGACGGAAVAMIASPYKLRFVADRRAAREYYSFSWPLVVARLSGIVIGTGSMIVGSRTVGLEGVGAIALAISIVAFSDGVSAIVTQTIYPAVCAVRDRADLFAEAFVKSNRLALMWGMPFGIAVAVFAGDLVQFVLGTKWGIAVGLLQAFGIMAALDQIGFNWTAFLRAKNHTRPLAIIGFVTAGSFIAIVVPAMILGGLQGYGIAMVAITVITIGARVYYLDRLFDGFSPMSHALRAIGPSVPAVVSVYAVRVLTGGVRTLGLALAELALYCVVTAAATYLFERPLIGEMLGYLKREKQPVSGTKTILAP